MASFSSCRHTRQPFNRPRRRRRYRPHFNTGPESLARLFAAVEQLGLWYCNRGRYSLTRLPRLPLRLCQGDISHTPILREQRDRQNSLCTWFRTVKWYNPPVILSSRATLFCLFCGVACPDEMYLFFSFFFPLFFCVFWASSIMIIWGD